MEITDVRITLADEGELKGFAAITLDNCIVITGLTVVEGQDGMFVGMPFRRRGSVGAQDIVYPIGNATRRWMEDIVLAKYEEVLARPESGDMDTSGVRSPLYPPIRPLFGWEARELLEADEEPPEQLGRNGDA